MDPDDKESLVRLLKNITIRFSGDSIFVDGIDVTSAIRTGEIGELSSRVSAQPAVRDRLYSLQREMGMQGSVVIEGRDTGTVIFPESENKFYLDASIEERARRRFEELKEKDPEASLTRTIEDIRRRDTRDSSRESSPLVISDDMIYIDSTDLGINEVVARILEKLT